ncbi:MAG: L-fuculose-phosphate aldolase [Desulfobacteraceae bacterium]
MLLLKERKEIIKTGRKMLSAGLTTGTGGNISCFNREQGLIAITPSGIEYPDLECRDLLVMSPRGKIIQGENKPSSETGFHLGIYGKREDVTAVVHTHSVYATTFACLNREIPAVHYLVGFAGTSVPVAPYATFGTDQLSQNINATLGNCNAVLLANHGLVAVGSSLVQAFNTAEEIELVARICFQAESIGSPSILSNDEMARVIEKFADYGPGK